ncbi:uncharacterized protein E0L32_000880 [Thyridium curvatum]|uniref:Mtf2-like C-terminal domain-containing protein n=1 Tax=Thyridium curvatum TaxID=1093900 RepID=A0A507AYJ7_9PEZI|nr:uncharacterized protein E0L32_000880 [Thyridium curvatum]TPX12703.1 hypothetical protein E0L32_000880 [Thyridium curvatum]
MSATTLLPFLYQTRTLQRLPRSKFALQVARSFCVSASNRAGGRPDHIPFELPPELQNDRSIAPDVPNQSKQRNRTITPLEQRAFEQIFNEIAARRPTPVGFEDQGKPTNLGSLGAASHDGNVVISEDTSSASGVASARTWDPEKALKQFPASLRKAAGLALGVAESPVDPNIGEQQEEADGTVEMAVDEAARKERHERWQKITVARAETEALMTRCKTDFELWGVMEKEVFGLIDKLGVGVEKKKAEERMDVYGPLYPLYLVHGLRLLDSHFAQSSPLVFSVLPRIKELGLASYVLGASTPLYNSLMSIYWHRYGDVPAVLSILEEMQEGGLFFDGASLGIVRDMKQFYARCRDGSGGELLGSLVKMPEYAAAPDGRIAHWQRVIEKNIKERQKSPGY